MTETQLKKLKGRLLNIQVQLASASALLSKGDLALDSKIHDATKIVADVLIACDSIKTQEVPQPVSKKKYKKREQSFSDLVPHEVIIQRNEPATYNRLCRNYSEIRTATNKVLERTCVVGMDMCYCSKKCAYATNNVCSLRG
jgi:hypothetical protein